MPFDAGMDVPGTLEEMAMIVTEMEVGSDQLQRHLSAEANAHSTSYNKSQETVYRIFLDSLQCTDGLRQCAELVADPESRVGNLVRRFVLYCRGKAPSDLQALRFMNKLLVNFFYLSKKADGSHVSASTWATRLKTLLSSLKRNQGLCYSAGDFKGFPGSLYDVEAEYWAHLRRQDPSFSKSTRGTYTAADYAAVEALVNSPDFRATAFSHEKNNYFMMAMNHAIGTTYALRGRQEHKDLLLSSFELGVYEDSHPWAGQEFLALKDQSILSKTNRLVRGNCRLFFAFVLSFFISLLLCSLIVLLGNENALNRSEYGNVNRFPVVENDWTNPGCLFKLLIANMLASDHETTPLYLFKYSPGQIARHKGRFYFNLNTPMGVNTVSSLFPDLCQLASVVGRKTPHMMRTFVATRLANDPRVSQAEVAAALRHTSLASQKAYVVPTVHSEVSRANALGVSSVDGDADYGDAKPASKLAKRRSKEDSSVFMKKASTVPKNTKKKPPTMAIQPFAAAAAASAAAMMPAAAFGFGMNPMAAFMQQQASLMAPYGTNPFMMMPAAAAVPSQGPNPAALAALGLSQAQIEAAMAAADSSDEE